ncbi:MULTISPECIES: K+/H+ antiporter subunit F [Paracoccus]|jgi:multicomponent K+:H+ antiporter subunit F|uniref:K+/H+ antiporter subunit F n=1 Tax=Paracoccus litorisediminis TaxID=2006130 RepID=A0A844HND3_9RHOB|nr:MULTISPECIES: K+/H+ antiporter subunit F [Paracoccus]MBD9527968.1 K+/H+ antiporter subunit F [Paracoccus sp. PAR01]MTH59867.1 K+/H+ antiporter subunit F [Paracoccus litorisediminis]
MSANLILEYALSYAQIAMVVAIGLTCWRIIRGPRAQDRVLAIDTMYLNAMLLFLLIGMGNGNVFFFEGALVIAVLGFITTVCAAKFLMRGEVVE